MQTNAVIMPASEATCFGRLRSWPPWSHLRNWYAGSTKRTMSSRFVVRISHESSPTSKLQQVACMSETSISLRQNCLVSDTFFRQRSLGYLVELHTQMVQSRSMPDQAGSGQCPSFRSESIDIRDVIGSSTLPASKHGGGPR